MKGIFERIFEDSNETYENDLNTASLVAMSKKNVDEIRHSTGFDFAFDNNGTYKYITRQHGFGKSVKLRGKITVPGDGVYSVNIRSSDGGGGKWDGIRANQEVSCIINTSFWHETTITVYIYSNKPNCNGHAIIDYSL